MTNDYEAIKKAHGNLLHLCDRQKNRLALMEDCIRRLLYYTSPEDWDAAEAYARRVLAGNNKVMKPGASDRPKVGESLRQADALSATHSLRARLPDMPKDKDRQQRQFAPGPMRQTG